MCEHPDEGVDQNNGRKIKRSNAFLGWNTIYGRAGEHSEPYMTRIWLGRLRLHIFHRGDNDPDCHDHPWDFWTFPLTSYVEQVAYPDGGEVDAHGKMIPGSTHYGRFTDVVPAFRLSFRSASHCHRVLGSYSGNVLDPFGHIVRCSASRAAELPMNFKPYYDNPSRKIITLVWRGGECRKWGFLKHRDGKWCWVYWKDYVFGGGKDSPCQ